MEPAPEMSYGRIDRRKLRRALVQLEERFPEAAEVAFLRVLQRLSLEEIAILVERAQQDVERDWRLAKAEIYARLKG